MNRKIIRTRKTFVQIFVFLAFKFTAVFSEKYEKTTSCTYKSVSGIESFEFICESNKTSREFFDDGSPIQCQGGSYYKERRHEISFRDCYFKQLPMVFKWYGAVRKFNVSSLELEAVQSRNFDYAENLLILIASHNKVTEIPSFLLSDSKKIALVDFSDNKINRIDPMAFKNENNLTSLDLSNNLIHEIENQTFVKLTKLEILKLSYNFIGDISSGLLDDLNNLKELHIDNNLLKRVQCLAFVHLTNLKVLNLAKNSLREFNSTCVQSENAFVLIIEKNLLINLTLSQNVSEVHASVNKIKTIFVERGLENITIFDISNNNVENVPEILKQIGPQVKYLDISDSKIGKLNVSTFDKFDNLEHLSLRNTNLSNIQFGTFHHQQKLRSLDLSNNKLRNINFRMLQWNSVNLQSFYLDGNMLEDLDNLTKVNYPSLQYLSINNNNFDCDYLSGIQQILKMEGISIISNQKLISDVQNSATHVNGTVCYHNSVLSELNIPTAVDKEQNEENITAASTAETNAMWKVEILLICIIIVLACLLIVSIVKNFVPAIKRNRLAQENLAEQVHYRSKFEEQSLI